jgi:hypothetical protein
MVDVYTTIGGSSKFGTVDRVNTDWSPSRGKAKEYILSDLFNRQE